MAPPMNCKYLLLLSLFIIGTNSRNILEDPVRSVEFSPSPTTSRPYLGAQYRNEESNLISSTTPSTPDPTRNDVYNPGPTSVVKRTTPKHDRWSYKDCGIGKKCVPTYLCPLGTVIEDGGGVFDTRFGGSELCPRLETCCSFEEIDESPSSCPTKIEDECGHRNVGGIGYKILETNNEAQFGEFPWMMAVLHKSDLPNPETLVYKCGGSLLTPKVVLTGGHCMQDGPAESYVLRAGEWKPNNYNEVCPDQRRNVAEIIVHEAFNPRNLFNDVALLIADLPFELAPNVNTVCLPPPDLEFDYSNCYATGWGKDKFHNGRYSSILKKIDLPVVPRSQCQTSLRKTRLSKFFKLHLSFMCAGGHLGKDTCKGDGGSPLVCPMKNSTNRYYQAGIVAWGIGCFNANVPGVYASVPRFRTWIDQQLAARNIDSSFYTI